MSLHVQYVWPEVWSACCTNGLDLPTLKDVAVVEFDRGAAKAEAAPQKRIYPLCPVPGLTARASPPLSACPAGGL